MAGSVHGGRQEAMRATSVMRFVIFGAVGFGIGWAIAGFLTSGFLAITLPNFQPPSPPPPWWVQWSSQLAYFLGGACGGAALGLAIGSWKRVLDLAVAGFIGFGLGSFLFFFLAFLFGLHLVGIAVGMGLFGGVSLGLTFGDWKRVVLLGLVGMVGFGVGGAIAAAMGMPPLTFDWEQPPLLLVLYVLVQAMVGLIGGASLGAALGYLEKRKLAEERRPRVR
jgi:hypothetical protein